MDEQLIPDPVAAAAQACPDQPILSTDDGRRHTGAALDRIVARRAGMLVTAGLGDGTRVGIAITDRFEAAITALAGIRAGAVVAPLDPTARTDSVTSRIDHGDIDALVTDVPNLVLSAEVPRLDPEELTWGDPLAGDPVDPEQSVTLMFTSGTTGEPRPVVHTAANHAAASAAAVDGLGLDTDDRWYVPLGLHHMGGFAPLTRCLPEGMQVVISAETGRDDLFDRITETSATVASVVPTMVHRAVEADEPCPSSLRCLLVGGAPLREPLFRRARTKHLPVWASYGLTETVGQVATATPMGRDRHPGTVGRPLPGIEVDIINDDGDLVDTGESGRIVVEGPTVSPSVGEPATDGRRFLTSDVGRLDETGRLWVHGRVDDAIQTGGKLVHPERVAEVLVAQPGVEDAAVVGRPDPEWGERVVAVVVDDGTSGGTLTASCRDQLPAHAVPKAVHRVDEIPRTVSGTIDRAALRLLLDDT